MTQDVAARLAIIARKLERRHAPDAVAAFLVRYLFTMFAEDVDLIPRRSFETILVRLCGNSTSIVSEMAALRKAMDRGSDYPLPIQSAVRGFNGSLFSDRTVLALDAKEIGELHMALRRD